MQMGQCPTLVDVRRTLESVTSGKHRGARIPLLWRVRRVILYPYIWASLLRVAHRMEKVAVDMTSHWEGLWQASEQATGYFSLPDEKCKALDTTSFLADLAEIEADINSLHNQFPSLIKRMLDAIAISRKAARNIGCVVPRPSAELIEASHREHEQGSLLTLETFINEVQGVR